MQRKCPRLARCVGEIKNPKPRKLSWKDVPRAVRAVDTTDPIFHVLRRVQDIRPGWWWPFQWGSYARSPTWCTAHLVFQEIYILGQIRTVRFDSSTNRNTLPTQIDVLWFSIDLIRFWTNHNTCQGKFWDANACIGSLLKVGRQVVDWGFAISAAMATYDSLWFYSCGCYCCFVVGGGAVP